MPSLIKKKLTDLKNSFHMQHIYLRWSFIESFNVKDVSCKSLLVITCSHETSLLLLKIFRT